MRANSPLRVAALIDLPRSPQAGGHVKYWERLARAAAATDLPLDLTVYFSGRETTEVLGPRARLRQLPARFSTARLKFLPYVPDHTDLASFHPKLARELTAYDVIHTTDAYFAFSRTAEKVSRAHHIPLVTSFHTDTPSYTRIFTRQTIEAGLGESWLARKLIDDWNMPERQGGRMDQRLRDHLGRCDYALATRDEDHALAGGILGRDRVSHLRLGVDKKVFGPHRADRAGVERDFGLPTGQVLVLFVGRLDVGKNIQTLVEAIARLRAEGAPVHLVTAGVGPAEAAIRERLGDGASVLGFVKPANLARLYASVDVMAIPSEVEIGSLVAVEAIASGCPVLVSEKSGVPQLFGRTAAMRGVASGADAWTDALRGLCQGASQRPIMRLAAIAYAREHVASWRDVLADDLLGVWSEAAGVWTRIKTAAA